MRDLQKHDDLSDDLSLYSRFIQGQRDKYNEDNVQILPFPSAALLFNPDIG